MNGGQMNACESQRPVLFILARAAYEFRQLRPEVGEEPQEALEHKLDHGRGILATTVANHPRIGVT